MSEEMGVVVVVVEGMKKVGKEKDHHQEEALEEEKNPLMIEDILDKIFPYFNDKQNLTSFRLVNQAWNSSVLRTIQNKLTWTIGEKMGRNEEGFLSRMNDCKNTDVFKNFYITPCVISTNLDRTTQELIVEPDQRSIRKFLQKYGSNIIDLEFHALSLYYTKSYLNHLHLLPNLKRLKLYDMRHFVLGDPDLLLDTGCMEVDKICLPNLHHICFHRSPQLLGYSEYSTRTIYFNLLKATPACKELEINLQNSSDNLLASTDPYIVALLATLTSFNTLLGVANYDDGKCHSPTVFTSSGFKNLVEKCNNLQKLRTSLVDGYGVEEEEIYEYLAELRHSLLELNLELVTRVIRVQLCSGGDSWTPATMSVVSQDKENSGDLHELTDDGDEDLDSIVGIGSSTGEIEDNEEEEDSHSEVEEEPNPAAANVLALSNYTSGPSIASPNVTNNEIDKPPAESENHNVVDDVHPVLVPENNDEESQHGIKRSHDDDQLLNEREDREEEDEEPGKKIRIQKVMFPYLANLRKLTLKQFHLYNNYDVFNNMPTLVHVDLEFAPCNSTEWPIIEPTYGHDNVKYLRLRSRDDPAGAKLKLLATAFPSLTELDVDVANDTSLRVVFEYMSGLKRLQLNTSKISDLGMTGILGIDPAQAHLINWGSKQPGDWRSHPYIGNLIDLQHLTYNGVGLTHMSVDHGIIDCKHLTYLKLPPYEERTREGYYAEPHYNYKDAPEGSLRAQIVPILENCSYLVRLDIRNGNKDITSTGIAHDSGKFVGRSNDGAAKYTVDELDLAFVKAQAQAPYFKEILFDTKE